MLWLLDVSVGQDSVEVGETMAVISKDCQHSRVTGMLSMLADFVNACVYAYMYVAMHLVGQDSLDASETMAVKDCQHLWVTSVSTCVI